MVESSTQELKIQTRSPVSPLSNNNQNRGMASNQSFAMLSDEQKTQKMEEMNRYMSGL